MIRCRKVNALRAGVTLYRNISTAFEKSITSHPCTRMMTARCTVEIAGGADGRLSGSEAGSGGLDKAGDGITRRGETVGYIISASARTDDGRCVSVSSDAGCVRADNPERMLAMLRTQIGKSSGQYLFTFRDGEDAISVRTEDGGVPFVSAASLNALRRAMAEALDKLPVQAVETLVSRNDGTRSESAPASENGTGADACDFLPEEADYRFNVSNALARQVYLEHGARKVKPAYELCRPEGAELMRTRYCIRYELGICPKHRPSGTPHTEGQKPPSRLFLKNNGHTLALGFDCANCEMTVSLETQA